jgi:hypothetical protein
VHGRRKMRRQEEVFGSGDRRLQTSLDEALKRLVTILGRQAARETVTSPALIMEPADGR